MKKYLLFCEKFNKGMVVCGVALLAFATVLTFVQVVSRDLFSFSFTWAEELTRYIIIFAVYFASGYIFFIDANASVDILYTHFSTKIQCFLTFAFYLLISIFLIVMGYYGYVCVVGNLTTWCASVPIPWGVPFAALVLGSVNMLLQVPAKVYKNYLRLVSKS
jgi:TRAP-type C4-dicarboxylate transport system permease small subunit